MKNIVTIDKKSLMEEAWGTGFFKDLATSLGFPDKSKVSQADILKERQAMEDANHVSPSQLMENNISFNKGDQVFLANPRFDQDYKNSNNEYYVSNEAAKDAIGVGLVSGGLSASGAYLLGGDVASSAGMGLGVGAALGGITGGLGAVGKRAAFNNMYKPGEREAIQKKYFGESTFVINKPLIIEEALSSQKDPEKIKKGTQRDKEWGHDPKMTKECQNMSRHTRVCGGCINDLKRKYKNNPKMLKKIEKARQINLRHKK